MLAEKAQYDLFHHSCRKGHCLTHLYIVKLRPSGAMRLITCGHDFELSTIKYEFNKRNFIVRSLFNYVRFFSCIICHCGDSFFKLYSVKCAIVVCNKCLYLLAPLESFSTPQISTLLPTPFRSRFSFVTNLSKLKVVTVFTVTRKRGNSECIATWGSATPRSPYPL